MKRISKRKLEEYNQTLHERDKAILHSIKKCKFLKSDQVGRLYFRGSINPTARLRAASRSLAKLHRLGLIQPLKRRIGGSSAGSASYVWTLKMAGVDLLRLGEEATPTKSKTRKRIYEPTYIFLKHTLAVAELYTYLRTNTNLISADFEPVCWRTYNKSFGVATTLKPDLYAITVADGYEDHYFFEMDLDTEAPIRIMRKCESYGRYYLAGQEQKRTGVFPRVVWVVPTQKRKEALRRHIHENLGGYEDLFAITTLEGLPQLVQADNLFHKDNLVKHKLVGECFERAVGYDR